MKSGEWKKNKIHADDDVKHSKMKNNIGVLCVYFQFGDFRMHPLLQVPLFQAVVRAALLTCDLTPDSHSTSRDIHQCHSQLYRRSPS